MSDYQIISVSAIKKEDKESHMLDSLEKIVREEVKKGWKPVGGISWSSWQFVSEKIHVSQALHKPE